MKRRIPAWFRIVGYVFAIVFIIAGWWITAVVIQEVWAVNVLPTPAETLDVLMASAAELAPYFWTSAYRVVVSLLIGTMLAVPIAHVFTRSRVLDALFAPVLYLLYPIPKVVLLPILLVLLGLADAPKIVLIALTVFFQVLVAVRDSVKAVPETATLSIRSLGGSWFDEYIHVVVPATLPAVFTSLRIGVGTAIAVLFIAESMAGSTGLGYYIKQAWGRVDYTHMFAGIVAIALLGVVLYAIFDVVERLLTRWK